VLVVKNVNKASVLTLIAILLFVFSCGGEAEKKRVRIEREIAVIKDSFRVVRESFHSSHPSRSISEGDTIDLNNLPASLANGGSLLFIPNGKAIVVGLPPVSLGNGSDLLYLNSLYIFRLDSLNRVLRSLP
jgi:hypothetical protein